MKRCGLIRLCVVLLGVVPALSSVEAQTVVSSFSQLMPYLDDHNVNVKMTPGTYPVTPTLFGSGRTYPNPHMFEFTGTNSVFDFTDVTFEVDTELFQDYGNVDIREIYVIGNDLVLSNLTLIDIGKTKPSFRAQSILLDGRRNRIEGFNLAVRGSKPYGYGDIFGKGGGAVIAHDKHSAILIRGIDNHLKDTKIFHRSYGHGIFCQGSQNATIEGCYVEGETRTSDDMLAEAGSGSAADNVGFLTDWGQDENGQNGYMLQPGYMFSLQEDGIRAYNTGLSIDGVNSTNTANITVIDCTVNKMRTGVNIGFCNNMKYVENCVVIDVESGLWLGTEGEAVNFAANAAYGPLLVTANYSNDRDSDAEITVLDSSNRYGNELLAYIAGARDEVTFRCRDEYVDTNLVIKVAGIRTGIRQHYINPKYNDHNATDAVLHNYTQFPVEMGTKSTGTTGETGGSVVDYGTGNSLTPISVSTAGGFAVIQTIEAEDFSSQSGADIMTRGDGVRFIGAADDGDWICFENFFMGSGPNRFEARVAGGAVDGDIELRLDSVGGELIGTCSVSSNAGSVVWSKETITLDEPRGKHDLYLVFKGTSGELPEIDSFRFYVTFPGWKSQRGLVGHWKFDEGAGTTATDSSGFENHGTVADAAWVGGRKGGALDFDGSSSTVSIPTSAFDTVQEEITIAFWAFGDAAQPVNNSAFYAKDGNNDRVLNIHLPYGDSKIYWDAGYDSGYDRIEKAASPFEFEGSWAHWVFTKNAKTGNMRIYRNGAIWHHAAFKMREIFDITAAAIGSQIGGTASYNGMIDDVRLYDVELMEHEVTELYDSYLYTDAGTPIFWLAGHGLLTGGGYDADDQLDPDGDGSLNWQEFQAGTDPTNSASVLRLINADASGSQMTFDWSSVAGKTYSVWRKDTMTDDAWTLQEEVIPDTAPVNSSSFPADNGSGFVEIEVE